MAGRINPDWKAVRDLTSVMRREAAAADAVVVADLADTLAASEAATVAAIEAVPVRDTPRAPTVIADASALYLLLKHVIASGNPELQAAIAADAPLMAWYAYMTPPPLGDPGG